MKIGPTGFLILCFTLFGLFFGCSATKSGNTAAHKQYPDRFVQRTLTDYQGKPFLRIACEYIGRQPYEGYQTSVPWQTDDIDFYNIQFENLTRHKITFISKKVYQNNARQRSPGSGDTKLELIEFSDFTKQPDSDFDRLEPLEECKLINWAFKTNDQPSNIVASIVFQIRYVEHDYTFYIHLHDAR